MLAWNQTTRQQMEDSLYQLGKQAAVAHSTYALAGRLYLSESGFALLSAPNAMARGLFDALDEPGAELPLHNERLNAHITVFRPEELAQLGGPDKLTERGRTFRYSFGAVKCCQPEGWDEVSKVWFLTVNSPELEALRKSYGLSPLPKEGKHEFHLTFALRKKKVLQKQAAPDAIEKRLAKLLSTWKGWEDSGKGQLLVNQDQRHIWLSVGDWHDCNYVKVWHKSLKDAFPGWEVTCESEALPKGDGWTKCAYGGSIYDDTSYESYGWLNPSRFDGKNWHRLRDPADVTRWLQLAGQEAQARGYQLRVSPFRVSTTAPRYYDYPAQEAEKRLADWQAKNPGRHPADPENSSDDNPYPWFFVLDRQGQPQGQPSLTQNLSPLDAAGMRDWFTFLPAEAQEKERQKLVARLTKATKTASELPYREKVNVYALRDGKILTAFRSQRTAAGREKGDVFVAGGGIDPGETPEQAAVRELKEEMGYDATNPRPAGVPALLRDYLTEEEKKKRPGFRGDCTRFYLADCVGGSVSEATDRTRKRGLRFRRPDTLLRILSRRVEKNPFEGRHEAVFTKLQEEQQKEASFDISLTPRFLPGQDPVVGTMNEEGFSDSQDRPAALAGLLPQLALGAAVGGVAGLGHLPGRRPARFVRGVTLGTAGVLGARLGDLAARSLATRTQALPWQEGYARLAGGLLSGGGAAGLLYYLTRQRTRKEEEEPATKTASFAETAYQHLPRLRMPETVVGGLTGGALGYLLSDEDKKRTGRRWRNALVSALAAAGAANLVSDRARRWISNKIVPYGYGTQSLLPTSAAELWHGAVLDEPVYPRKTLAENRWRVREQFDNGGDTAQQARDMRLAARRELVRRQLGVHASRPGDIWAQNEDQSYSINPSHPHGDLLVNKLLLGVRHDNQSDIRNPETALGDLNADATGQGSPPNTWGFMSHLVGGQLGKLTPVSREQGRPTLYGTVRDRWDYTLNRAEADYLRQGLVHAAKSPQWLSRRVPDGAALDYELRRGTNQQALAGLLSRHVMDRYVVDENPWIKQHIRFDPAQEGRWQLTPLTGDGYRYHGTAPVLSSR